MTNKIIKQINPLEQIHYVPISLHQPARDFHRKNVSSEKFHIIK